METGTGSRLESLADRLAAAAGVRTVFGDPVTVGDKVIIPVARVMCGLGGGHGSGVRRGKNGKEAPAAEGEGGGGGIVAVPAGVYEVSGEATRFIPTSPKWLRTAALLAAGVTVGIFLAQARRR